MMAYEIVNTQPSDRPFIYWLFDGAIAYQKKYKYPVWADDKDVLQQDIEDQRQYKVLTGDGMAGIFTVYYTDPIVWRERDRGDAIYLHRIVVNPNFKGQQLFGKVLNWAKQRTAEQKLRYIRMDTWADNPTIIAYYQRFGFNSIDYYTTPESEELPVQQRGNDIVLLEYEV